MVNSHLNKVVSCLVIVAFVGATTRLHAQQSNPPTPPLSQSTTTDGMRDGELLASQKRTGGNFGGGLAVGLLTGLIGPGIGYVVIGPDSFTPEAMQMNQGKGPEYQLGFKSGWEKKTQEKKRNAFFMGGLLGSAALLVFYVSVTSSHGK